MSRKRGEDFQSWRKDGGDEGGTSEAAGDGVPVPLHPAIPGKAPFPVPSELHHSRCGDACCVWWEKALADVRNKG